MDEKERLEQIRAIAKASAISEERDDLERALWSNLLRDVEPLIEYLQIKEEE